MRTAGTVIIGGGVVGASVAYHLTERGEKDVLILEGERVQGNGSTGAATGGIRAQFETKINIALSLYSLDFFKTCEFETGYDPKGYLFFATDEEQLQYLRKNVLTQREAGVRNVEIVGPDTIREIVPGMHCGDILGGTFGRDDGFINPLAVMRGFTGGSVERGAKIECGNRVTAIVVENGKAVGVETSAGPISCANVVLCAGAVVKGLAKTAGVDLPVEPQRRQIVWAKTASPLPPDLPMVIDLGTGFHFRPAKDFRDPNYPGNGRDILFAHPDPDEPLSSRTDFDDGFVEKVYEKARLRAEFLFRSTLIREKCRAGLYENTPDHHAIIGGCEIGNLFLASGFSGHGVMHSPATGRAVAEIILDGEASFMDVTPLSLGRFAGGEMLHETAFI